MTLQTCSRCGCQAKELYDHKAENGMGEKVKMKLCWDCDFDVTNGRGDYFDDAGEVQMEREEEDYLWDPINNPKPRWM